MFILSENIVLLLKDIIETKFDAFFWLLVGFVTVFCNVFVESTSSRTNPRRKIPSHPDPYEIIYLRGGVPDVSRLVTFNLWNQGFLMETNCILRHDRKQFNSDQFSSIEKKIYDVFGDGVSVSILRSRKSLASMIAPDCIILDIKLRSQKNILSKPEQTRKLLVYFSGLLIILFVAVYRLTIVPELQFYDEIVVVFTAIVGVLLLAIGFQPRSWRISSHGKYYLIRLKRTFSKLRGRMSVASGSEVYEPLLAVAIFGPSILDYSPFRQYQCLFRDTRRSSSGDNNYVDPYSGHTSSHSSFDGGCNSDGVSGHCD